MQRTGFVFKKAGKWSSLMFTYSHNQKSVGIQNQVRKLPTFNSAASLHIRDLGELNSSKNRAKTHFVRNVYSPLSVTHSEWVVQLQEDDESEILLTCFWSSVRVWTDTMQSLSVKSWCFEWGTPEWGQNGLKTRSHTEDYQEKKHDLSEYTNSNWSWWHGRSIWSITSLTVASDGH